MSYGLGKGSKLKKYRGQGDPVYKEWKNSLEILLERKIPNSGESVKPFEFVFTTKCYIELLLLRSPSWKLRKGAGRQWLGDFLDGANG